MPDVRTRGARAAIPEFSSNVNLAEGGRTAKCVQVATISPCDCCGLGAPALPKRKKKVFGTIPLFFFKVDNRDFQVPIFVNKTFQFAYLGIGAIIFTISSLGLQSYYYNWCQKSLFNFDLH